MRARLLWLLVAGLAGLAVVAGQARADTITLGQTGTGLNCGGAGVVVQPAVAGGNSYTVPSGTWHIKSWSTQAGASGGQLALVAFRPSGGPNQYTVVAGTKAKTLTANVLNTFKTKKSINNVKGGDLIGFWCGGGLAQAAFGTGSGGDSAGVASVASVPSTGTTITFTPTTGARANISVVLSKAN